MRIRYQTSLLAFILFAFLSINTTSCLASEEIAYQRVDELLLQGENQQAWEILQGLSEKTVGPDRVEISWRMARTQYEMGRLEAADKKSLTYFQDAEKYAREAIAEAPDKSDGYKWLAIALGAQAKYSDTETQIRQSREIKVNIEKAIILEPGDDLSYLVLSRWHYKVSSLGFFSRAFANIVYGGLPEASLKEAEKLLLKAIGLRDRIAHRYNLAKVYDRMDHREDVKKQYQKAILLPVTFPEEAEELDKARNKLKKWQ